jgi:polyhydroxyalkanoate synthase subunit PhaC
MMFGMDELYKSTLAFVQAQPISPDMWRGVVERAIPDIKLDPQVIKDWQTQYAQALMHTMQATTEKPAPLSDKRFAQPAWAEQHWAHACAQLYLTHSQHLQALVERIQASPKQQQKLRFAMQQWLDAASPANSLVMNPDALALAVQTAGESLRQGLDNLLGDMQKGKLSQSDDSAFTVGKNVGTSEGQVVFENHLFQLIEYRPLTESVYVRPLLIVPPCINKFYILDLQPDNSLVRYALEQGQRVFLVSWVNPNERHHEVTWDDYIEHAVIEAIKVTCLITNQPHINILGFCVGGTLVTTALAVLAARNIWPCASLTLLTTLLDFSDTGILDVFIDEQQIVMRELQFKQGGLLRGTELANTFSALRPNELMWNYVVGNYLKGNKPPAFDLLYWNGDSTNLPGYFFTWYLRHTYLQDELKIPNKLTVCGEKLDLSVLDMPVFIYGSKEDHIVPWTAAYASTQILSGDKTFVLGASGHIAGVVNPPAKRKRNYWKSQSKDIPQDASAWFAQAQSHEGSWWTTWSEWLATQGGANGERVPAPVRPGNAQFKPIEPAPGRYVLAKS